MINEFTGQWTKLSNYSLCSIWYDGHIYPSIEHAYQAMKSSDPNRQQIVRNAATPNMAKKLGRMSELRPDWEDFKIPLMRALIAAKFCQEPERSILLSTGSRHLEEGNTWGDVFWGVYKGKGQNVLGQLLMQYREELRNNANNPGRS